jgi:diguanylate cyclase (GGDEF)-like protein
VLVSYLPQHRLPGGRRRRWAGTRTRLTATSERVSRVSLLARFGVLSAVLLAGLGMVLAVALKDTVQNRALVQAEHAAANVARMGVEPLLHVSDFQAGRIDPQRLARLRSTLRAGVADDGQVVRIKVYDGHGTLLYSDDTAVIGERSTSDDLSEALAGGIVSGIEEGEHEAGEEAFGTLLEVYVPVRMPTSATGGEHVVGAFEIYLDYAPIAQGTAADVRQLLWCLGLGLVALWAGLFQLMTTASRRLRHHAQTNEWLARHDSLTGLPNRAMFTERAGQAVRAARRDGTRTAVLLIDVDRFRDVNDTLGHHTGDALLRAVGDRLREQLTETVTVARLGGDEYAVLLPCLSETFQAEQVAAELLAELRGPVVVDGLTLEIDASLGVAVCPDHATTEGELLQRADAALSHAKQHHDGVVVYRSDFDVHTPERLALVGELRRAIEDNQLVLHYQPKADVDRGRVTGVEALVRWQHPRRGLLFPADFIPLAEQTGLIRQMTLHLLETALRDCRAWRDGGLDLSVAVNLSARSLLCAELPEQVARTLARHALPPCALELEITETTAMADPGRALAVLESLRALGVRLSVDDYGTGHSSLSYLHQLPVDTLKIDKSFVQTMDSNPHEATIVRSTIDLARSLGLQVVAEGVETEAAWRQLALLGCDAAQGYWLARPGVASDVPRTIRLLEQRLTAGGGERAHEPAA